MTDATSLDSWLAEARRRKLPVPFELGAFVALEVCESLLRHRGPVGVDQVWLSPDGQVSVTTQAAPDSDAGTRAVSSLLAKLLLAAGSGVPPTLLKLVDEANAESPRPLPAVRDELEAVLVPLNRSASRRVLSRMLRESRRPSSVPGPQQGHDPDADLDALIGVERDAPRSRSAPQPSGPQDTMPETVLADPSADGRQGDPAQQQKWASPAAVAPPRVSPHAAVPDAQASEEPSLPHDTLSDAGPLQGAGPFHRHPSRRALFADAPPLEVDEPAASSTAKAWLAFLGFAALTAAVVTAVALYRPEVFDRLGGGSAQDSEQALAEQAEQASQQKARALAQHRKRFGNLLVEVQPAGTQVLRFLGESPVEAEELPVGVAQEFVAMPKGHRPSRAVVGPDAKWQPGQQALEGGQPWRYELALQSAPASGDPATKQLGKSLLPQDVGSSEGKLGTVRIITSPPEAKVYHLIGFGPTVRVQDLRTDKAHELLLYQEGYEPRKTVVSLSDWDFSEQVPRATIEAELEPL